jgi:hypothetical protein
MRNEDIKSPIAIFYYQEIFNVLESKKYVILVWPKFSKYIVNLTFRVLGMEKCQIWGGKDELVAYMCEEKVDKVYFQIR